MGCDIHMYVEYKEKDSKDKRSWNSFGKRINPGRNYWLFGLLAKVRCEFSESLEPKGLPEDIGYHSRDDNQLYISEDGEGENECTLKEANSWSRYGSQIIMYEGKPRWVTNPDWHSHSWVNCEEFKNALDIYNQKSTEPEPEYEALLSAMLKLSEYNNDVRIVFWFDN